jgi:hypothetical protein
MAWLLGLRNGSREHGEVNYIYIVLTDDKI